MISNSRTGSNREFVMARVDFEWIDSGVVGIGC